jgi:hypothetical protein
LEIEANTLLTFNVKNEDDEAHGYQLVCQAKNLRCEQL